MKNKEKKQYLMFKNCDGKYNAGNKFTNDVIKICSVNSIDAIGYGCQAEDNLLLRCVNFFKYSIKLCILISNHSKIYLLYPTMPKYFSFLCYIKQIKDLEVIGIVMDLPSLCRDVPDITLDIFNLKLMDKIIVQNRKQKVLLEKEGISYNRMGEIGILDFLGTPRKVDLNEWNKERTICYGGTLAPVAAGFIYKWMDTCKLKKLRVNIYGIGMKRKIDNEHFKYCGSFSPDKVLENLEGDFGLVWSGSEVNTCGGDKGIYYEYASPHKLSMYLMAGMPVIVSKNSALEDLVISKNIGIVIDSLNEIEERLDNISREEYQAMLEAVKREASIISRGGNIVRCLNSL